ncbi:MAG: SulP family inorganic anion transporter [Myxococcota bacterium]
MAEEVPGPSDPEARELKPVDLSIRTSLGHDLRSGLVVFLVALPLCLGIALASEAPLFSGILAGICGGIVVPLISRSPLSVSGPAAGLTAIVIMGIDQLESFEAFLVATFLAGLMQIALGLARAGNLGSLVPSSVIKGMLAAIGLTLILKQIPHAIGYDVESFGADSFFGPDGENTFSLFIDSLTHIEQGAVVVSVVSAVVLLLWEKTPLKRLQFLPGALAVVIVGTLVNDFLAVSAPELFLGQSHRVQLPPISGPIGFYEQLTLPDFWALLNPNVLSVALTVALVASIETMLSIEAVDKLDSHKRVTPRNRELVAQGAANTLSGLIGGLPVTSVIIRSSANVNAGGRTRTAALVHGVLLLLAVMFAASLLQRIPLACLAVLLLQVGYKLVRPSLIKDMYSQGWERFVPFAVTIGAIMITDLLRGVIVGLIVGLIFVLRQKTHRSFSVLSDGDDVYIRFNKDVSFIHRGMLQNVLREIEPYSHVVIDGSDIEFVDHDIEEVLHDFVETGDERCLEIEVRGVPLRKIDTGNAPRISAKVNPVEFADHSETGMPAWAYREPRRPGSDPEDRVG